MVDAKDCPTAARAHFSALTWNLLAEHMAELNATSYNVTGPFAKRLELIVERVKGLQPSLLAFQEVQHRHAHLSDHEILDALSDLHYEGIADAGGKGSNTAMLLWDTRVWTQEKCTPPAAAATPRSLALPAAVPSHQCQLLAVY